VFLLFVWALPFDIIIISQTKPPVKSFLEKTPTENITMRTHQLVHIEIAFTGSKRLCQLLCRMLRQAVSCTQHHIVIPARAFYNYLVHCLFLLCPFDIISITHFPQFVNTFLKIFLIKKKAFAFSCPVRLNHLAYISTLLGFGGGT
jgi:hypothetical protein